MRGRAVGINGVIMWYLHMRQALNCDSKLLMTFRTDVNEADFLVQWLGRYWTEVDGYDRLLAEFISHYLQCYSACLMTQGNSFPQTTLAMHIKMSLHIG